MKLKLFFDLLMRSSCKNSAFLTIVKVIITKSPLVAQMMQRKWIPNPQSNETDCCKSFEGDFPLKIEKVCFSSCNVSVFLSFITISIYEIFYKKCVIMFVGEDTSWPMNWKNVMVRIASSTRLCQSLWLTNKNCRVDRAQAACGRLWQPPVYGPSQMSA